MTFARWCVQDLEEMEAELVDRDLSESREDTPTTKLAAPERTFVGID